MSMSLEELEATREKVSQIQTVGFGFDDEPEEDICTLMAREDAEVIREWRGLAIPEATTKLVLVIDDEAGITEYMEQLPDGTLKSLKKD